MHIYTNYAQSHFDTPTVYKRIHLQSTETGNRVKAPVQLQGRDAGTTSRVGSPVQLRLLGSTTFTNSKTTTNL